MDLLLPFFSIKLGLISSKIRTTAIVSTWKFEGLFNSPSLIIADVVVHDSKNAFCSNTRELGTKSKNNLRGITLVRGPTWKIYSLALIVSCLCIILSRSAVWKKYQSTLLF